MSETVEMKPASEEEVREALYDVVDPELGIDVGARPVCLRYGIPATTRASFYLYSTPAEIDALVEGLEHVRNFFG